MPPLLLQLFFTLLLFLFFGISEFFLPAEKHQPLSGRLYNLFLGGIFIFTGILWQAFINPHIVLRAPIPSGIPNPFSLFFALLLADFCFYWYHRLQHHSPFFWKFHALHHRDTSVNVTTAFRTFWLEQPLQWFAVLLPVALFLNLDAITSFSFYIIATFLLCFTHANIRIPFGPLTKYLCGPQLHRLHHSSLPQHKNCNFAQFFSFIDVAFSTYRAPLPQEFPPTGITRTL